MVHHYRVRYGTTYGTRGPSFCMAGNFLSIIPEPRAMEQAIPTAMPYLERRDEST